MRISDWSSDVCSSDLLQDPGLAFHPPTLYIGYVGLSVAFSYAIAAMALREVGPAFARAMRPWVLGAWSILTVGIVAGSYWAYYELGWGEIGSASCGVRVCQLVEITVAVVVVKQKINVCICNWTS